MLVCTGIEVEVSYDRIKIADGWNRLAFRDCAVRNDLFKGKKEKENWFHLQFVCVCQTYLWTKSFMKPTPGNSSFARNANIYWLKN